LRLIQLRNQNPAFARAETEIADAENPHVFAYFRSHQGQSVFVLANFSEQEQHVDARRLRMLGLRRTMVDMVAGRAVTATQELTLEPYQLMALARST
jgi:amylosucrase/maltose alpha-D-glucosyltransferase/alpha-amylase